MADKKKNEMAVRKFSAYLNEFLANVMRDEDIPISMVTVAVDSSAIMLKEVKVKED